MTQPSTYERQPYIAPRGCSAAEWEARGELAAAYRIFDHLGWTEDVIYNHISLRVPGEEGHFLINPFGLHYSEVCASNLVKVDVDGTIIGNDDYPINPAGFTFHSAIHATVPDAHCVMHVHTTATQAVCCLEDGLAYTNFSAAQLWGRVAYHDFEGITIRQDEGRRILESAGGKPVLMLRNHGPVTMGPTVAHCFGLMHLVNRACETQLATQSMGRARPISDIALERCARDSLNFDPRFGGGQDTFDALRRLVDRIDPSYRR